jgi:tetratricopeptide (TPR) repeat protein
MKPIHIFLLSALVAGVTSFLVIALRGDRTHEADAHAATAAGESALFAQSLSEVSARQTAIEQSLDALRSELANRARAETRTSASDIDAAVERALERRAGHAGAAAGASADAAPETAAAKKFDARAALASLNDPTLSQEKRQAIWKEISDAGALDEVLAMLEQRASDDPRNAAAQIDLGRGYLQKVFKAGGGPEAGVWANKADKAFDSALAIDDHNWDARFQKAVSLSFWPPMLGKQNEAIQNFETLIAQQSGQNSSPQFAQSYLFLGNMYTQVGDKDKALATWQAGLALFPGNAQIQKQIALAQSH